jgi:GTP-binding protein HflX
VGYTNAGKSTLLNCLTGADIPANDRLFDTLDTTTRRLKIDDVTEALLSDTVGFIRKLPHHLVEAFKATLEELTFADALIHVIDLSSPDCDAQARVVDSLIAELGADNIPCVRAYNKCDAFFGELPRGEDVVCLSAKTGEGTAELLGKLSDILTAGTRRETLRFPYDKTALLDPLYKDGAVVSADYREDGVYAEAILKPETLELYKEYIT